VSSVTSGGDALGDVVVKLEVDGKKVAGRGLAPDVAEASARAFLNAINKIVRLRERPIKTDAEAVEERSSI
jgi:2-isopropylmalate synthase